MANDISAQAFREAAAKLVACQTCSNTGFIAVWSGGSLEGEGCPDCPQAGPEYHLLLDAAEQCEQLEKFVDLHARQMRVKDGVIEANGIIREGLKKQIATLTAERDDFRAEIGKLAGACTVLHANNAGLERERDEARATLAVIAEDRRVIAGNCADEMEARNRAEATLAQVRVHEDVMTYLHTLTITGDNIGDIRRSLFMPFDCQWNGWVREFTAQLEATIGAER